jgi:GlpG protein
MKHDFPFRQSILKVFFPTGRFEVGWLTLALVVGSLAVTLLTNFGTDRMMTDVFSITRYRHVDGIHWGWHTGLPEICQGEIWRLFTPMFIHFGFLHFFYNAIWIFIFGTLIEKRQGIWVLALLVLVTASLSSLAQYAVRGPAFGGMSGVMCGLLGYIWMRDLIDPSAGLRLDRLVLIWAVVCCVASCFGIFGTTGQIIHAAGFAIGLVIGIASGLLPKRS